MRKGEVSCLWAVPPLGLYIQDLIGGDTEPAPCSVLHACLTFPDLLSDAGAPVYFYEFRHRPQCFEDTKPAFVKADHADEVRFVFGGAFLKGDIVMFGKGLVTSQSSHEAPCLPHHDASAWRTSGLAFNYLCGL